MHGRPRKPPTPAEEKASEIKAAKIRPLQSQFLQFHHNKIYTKEALELNAKLLEANPEYLTAWNYRKLAVEHILSQPHDQTVTADSDSIESIFSEELRVTERALAKNYKSYGAWYHRKWVLGKGHSSVDRELQLLGVFLKKDSRNFHAWNYRRFVAALMNRSDEEELQFTTGLINENFSNYSAWHNRSVLLSHLLEKQVKGYFPKEKVLTAERDLVHKALFTDPDDQSGWFYHHWLLDQIVKVETPLLVSTWPPHGSSLNVSVDGYLDDCALSPMTSFHLYTGAIPVILYFSEAVEGVNSSTITVESSIYDTNNDLIWTPLSTNNSGSAQAWVTNIIFLEEKIQFSQANPIKVTVGCSQGIVSLSGFQFSHPTHFEFTIYARPPASQHANLQRGMISWGGENFHVCKTHLKESSQIKISDGLNNSDDNESTAYKWNAETIASEIVLFQELLEGIDCKIGKLTLARLLTAHDVLVSNNKTSDSQEVLELYSDLIKLDPPHSQFFKDEYSLVLLRQLTYNPESLLRHCYHYRDSSSSSINSYVCLRLCNLSLSRIGSMEQLLWIQMLDLSHNQLRSIEGVEAMQLLSCLNLSHNKISSFSALEPLKLLKSLKALNISYNEIGSHSVDTRRYLCSSPLSHTEGSEWNFGEFAIDGGDFTNYWDAFSIFKESKLTQLDIIGNEVAEERLKLFLVKIMPALKWLDGEELQ